MKNVIPTTLHCGRQARQGNQLGILPLDQADRGGISNALSWLVISWEKFLIFMLVGRTLSFLIMITSWPSRRHALVAVSG